MKMKKMLSMLLAGAMLVGLLAACGGDKQKPDAETQKPGTETQNPDDGEKKIYRLGWTDMSGYGSTYQAIGTVLKSLCEASGNVELIPVQIASGADGMQTTYENMINMGVDGILGVSFSEGSVRLMADLFEENDVDWFLVNRRLSDEDLKDYVFSQSKLVGNEFCYEEETAYQVVKRLHEDYDVKNLAVIGLTQGDAAGDLRDQGIAKACGEFGIKMLTETRGITSAGDVTNAVEGIISSYPEVDGIFIVGGNVTTGALAGANQALANHNMQDKVAIGMIDIAAGMGEYMGEGKPLKIVAGGNVLMDWVVAGACMINHANGVNTDKTPYIINTDILYITTPEDAEDYNIYFENPNTPMLSGEQWNETVLGKDLDTIQAFVDNCTLDYLRSMNK